MPTNLALTILPKIDTTSEFNTLDMNSSLSPNFEALEGAEPEAAQLQAEPILPNLFDSSEKPGESVQSLYDPSPIEYWGSDPLSSRGQMLFQRGIFALRAGEIETALEIWRQARAEFPSHAIIAHNLGIAAGMAQQYGEAVTAFHKANELDSSLIISNLNSVCASMSSMSYQSRIAEFLEQSKSLRAQIRYVEADKAAQRLLTEYPNSSAVLAELSIILAERSQLEPQKSAEFLAQALQHARRAAFLDPTLPAGLVALATAQRLSGTYREAFASSLRLLELQSSPDSSLRLFAGEHALGASRAEKNDQQLAQTAVEYADQVIAEEPANVRAWTLRADANAIRASGGVVTYDQNLADFERLLQFDPKNGRAMEFRDFLLAQGYQDEVIGKLKPVFKEALGYLQGNDNKKALPLLRQILKDEPDNRATLSNLSLALRRLKQFDEALSVQTHLAELSPTPESWRLVGAIALQVQNYEGANKAYLQVVELLPDEARSHGDVATTLERMGRVREAVPYWRRVVELTPDDKNAWSHLGKNLLNAGCSQQPVDESLLCEAIPALDKAQALGGSDTEVTSQLAVGLAEVGDSEKARDYAARLIGHDPVAHSFLVQILADIHSRRLSEGLASRPLLPGLLPSLTSPPLPIEHTGDYLVAQPFSPITVRSVSPLLVAVVGLLTIFGIWGAMLGFGYITPLSSAAPPPPWNQLPSTIVQPSSFRSFPPRDPSTTTIRPPFTATFPFAGVSMLGLWQGNLNGESANLLVHRREGNIIYGDIFVNKGKNIGSHIQVVGTLSRMAGTSTVQAISWHQIPTAPNPQKIDWALGQEDGTISRMGNELWMRSTATSADGMSAWSFSRDLAHSTGSTPASPSTDLLPTRWSRLRESALGFSMDYPAGWTSSTDTLGGRKRISFKAPSANVLVVIEVSDSPITFPLKDWQDQNERLRREYDLDYSLLRLEEANLGGQVGPIWQFDLKAPGQTQLRKTKRSVVYNGRAYTLTEVAPTKDFDKWRFIFDRTTTSFSFSFSSSF